MLPYNECRAEQSLSNPDIGRLTNPLHPENPLLTIIPVNNNLGQFPKSLSDGNGELAGLSDNRPARYTNAGPENLESLAQALRNARPLIRFDLYGKKWSNGSQHPIGFLFMAFFASPLFAKSEMAAMLNMIEMTATLLARLQKSATTRGNFAQQVVDGSAANIFALPFLEAKKQWIDAFEREYLSQLLSSHNGNISRVARAAGISRYTVYALLNKFEMSAKSFKLKKVRSKIGIPEPHKPTHSSNFGLAAASAERHLPAN